MLELNMRPRRGDGRGFTLLEVAVALVIVTLLVGGVLVPLHTQVEGRKIDETRKTLDQAREALLAYAAANGRFPCPADAASGGREPAAAVPGTGACPAYQGFFPAALLGFSPVDGEGYALDAWGGSAANRLRYAVSDYALGPNRVFTMAGGMANAGITTLANNYDLLYVCGSGTGVVAGTNCGAAMTLASNAVVVIWSSGPNASGAGTSVHEQENPSVAGGSADRIFVSKVRQTSGAGEFDDQLTWIPGYLALSRLIASGQLP